MVLDQAWCLWSPSPLLTLRSLYSRSRESQSCQVLPPALLRVQFSPLGQNPQASACNILHSYTLGLYVVAHRGCRRRLRAALLQRCKTTHQDEEPVHLFCCVSLFIDDGIVTQGLGGSGRLAANPGRDYPGTIPSCWAWKTWNTGVGVGNQPLEGTVCGGGVPLVKPTTRGHCVWG